VALREEVERVDESHEVPSHCPPPEARRVARLRVRPRLLPRLVVPVVEQPRGRVPGLLFMGT
jgi:hypothetical protein